MLIEMDKYQANSLRKNRREGFEKDISDAYTLFSYRYSDPHIITINDFYDFWNSSQLGLIVCLRTEDEEQQEYFQTLYRILTADYFVKGNDSKKVFAILCLYFFAYTVDVNGERNTRYIHINQEFITSLTAFLRQNTDNTKSFFVKVIKKIKQLFVYSIKSGVRHPLIKKNGETFIRYPKPLKKLNRDNYSPVISQIKQSLPGLEETIKSYHQAKQAYISSLNQEESSGIRKQLSFDKNISLRLDQILKSYESEVNYIEEQIKNISDSDE